MARRFNSSQFRSKIRQAQSKLRQAVSNFNRSIDAYNREVRAHNNRLRANRQRLVNELRKLQASTAPVRYQVVRSDAVLLSTRFEALEHRESEYEQVSGGSNFLDLSERESANSIELANALEADEDPSGTSASVPDADPLVLDILSDVSTDLQDRWRGALFSLSPQNPDAARHFCTSAREVFIQILEHYAPDASVIDAFPDCEKTDSGAPIRREKVRFMLRRAGLLTAESVEFVTEDVKNVLGLFRVFNDGTHGSSGRYTLSALSAIKQRVEHGICYLGAIARNV
ncbi:MAG: hypothetical protein MEQ07_01980 [Aquimonas sp.]|nr:hypothetical protein [Aquimonas sp.]